MGWIKLKDESLLAIMSSILIYDDPRISVSNDEDTWRLHIGNTRTEDSGTYMCQEDLTSQNPIQSHFEY